MASLSLLSTVPTSTTSLSSRPPSLFSKTTFKVSCKASADDHLESLPSLDMQNVDRRNLLLGLGAGGLYGAANLTSIGSALAYPITAPDNISNCVDATVGVDVPNAVRGVACCPPKPTSGAPKPDPYVLPKFSTLRIRQAAHRLTPEYIEKYRKAYAAMKALPDNDPHSLKQQARIHCAYCNGAYNQEMSKHPELKIQVHNSSLFFPFHRWYLYFHERILGKLIGCEDTFALPYWNWDNPTGMMLPAMFEATLPNPNDPKATPSTKFNPIFDPYRNVAHLPPTIVDLQYRGRESGLNCVDQISTNLSTMYSQMVSSAKTTEAFFGTDPDPVISSKGGSIESGAHTSLHIWTGNPRMNNGEDMGNFYSAGYDPVFYSHHANVDRMWQTWKDLSPDTHKDPSNDDWLNASFVFYDENKRLVRVYNRDCVNINKMGYDFEISRIPWANSRPTALVTRSRVAIDAVGTVKKAEEIKLVKLDQTVKVLVKRPARKRDEGAKKKEEEMLFLNGIKFNSAQFFKFDVLVNDVDDGTETTAASSEFAGTFAQVPHSDHGDDKMFMTSGAAFGITELLEDIEAEDDEYVLVTLVPRAGAEDATIAEIKIKLVPIG